MTKSLTIAELSAHPAHFDCVLDWMRSTWQDDNNEFALTLRGNHKRPGAIIALSGDSPIGVLAFKRHKTPSQTKPELWINALYVAPAHRRLGIGRRLVQFGCDVSMPNFATQLFAYTDIPSLYRSIGWEDLDDSAEFGTHTMLYRPGTAVP